MTTLLISSKNYSSWSLRGFLLARLAHLDFEEKMVAPDDPDTRAELLLRASSIRRQVASAFAAQRSLLFDPLRSDRYMITA